MVTRTSIVSRTSPSTVTVRFFPGTGGSGETLIDLSWLCMASDPHDTSRIEGRGGAYIASVASPAINYD